MAISWQLTLQLSTNWVLGRACSNPHAVSIEPAVGVSTENIAELAASANALPFAAEPQIVRPHKGIEAR
jgi:hypothetical protein